MTAVLLIARQRSALWVYAAVVIGTLVWAVSEVGFDWWPLAAGVGAIAKPDPPIAALVGGPGVLLLIASRWSDRHDVVTGTPLGRQ
jgi:glucose dehydrogenase